MSHEAIYQNRENDLDYANQSYIPLEFRQDDIPRDTPDNDIQLDDEDIEQLVRQHGVRPEVIQKQQEDKLKDLSKDANKAQKVNTKNNSILNLSFNEVSEGVALVIINIMTIKTKIYKMLHIIFFASPVGTYYNTPIIINP